MPPDPAGGGRRLRIAMLTGGGDCPGLNPAIRAVVRRADKAGHTVIGIGNGWAGLVEPGRPDARTLSREDVQGIVAQGGTILGTSRTNPLAKDGGLEAVEDNLAELDIDGLIAIGGDDTLSVAAALAERGGRIVGIPKTMDNDVFGTEACIGFDSAATTVMEALDKLQTTAASHHRVMVVEVMGRDAGWVATYAGLAGGADAILVPEHVVDIDALIDRLKERRQHGTGSSIVVVAEGVAIESGDLEEPPDAAVEQLDAFGHPRLDRRGIGEALGREVESRTGIETRVTVLGHVQRGGAPSLYDRVLATRYGVAAVDAVEEGRFGHMVALHGDRIEDVPLAEVRGRNRLVGPELHGLTRLFD